MLPGFHPVVSGWFESRFGSPTEPQAAAWPEIQAGRDVLVSAPTGSGKTFAAFLSGLDALFREGLDGDLPDETRILYVSPLRALTNDIEKNLREPLAALRESAAAAGMRPPAIRAAVRTGDTAASRRQALLRRPPHVLVTTPESLYLLLGSEKGRRSLAPVRMVIVDEIHAVARDKRGSHLALSLERLEALCARRPQRVGLSATVTPVEEVARFLVGAARVRRGAAECALVEVGRRRSLDLAVEIPRDELSSVASKEQWAETYDRLATLCRENRTTLVFVNTRKLAERAAHALAERLGPDVVAAHHGSLSRARRLDAEDRLKSGALRAVVATASLELGIDVGTVDLVCQLGSPGALHVALQRAGRSGHWRGATPRARLFPMSRDELVECAALVRGLRAGALEPVVPLPWPRDVLAQQVVAEAACRPLPEDELFALCRRAWPYRELPRPEFDALVSMLSEGIATRRGRSGALLHRDGVHRVVRGRRGARIAALTGGGAIPDSAQYQVVAEPEGAAVGQVDEDFAVESMAGDVFLLGNTAWRIRRIEAGVVRVEDAGGAAPGIPFWLGEAPGRSAALSTEVSRLRADLEPLLDDRDRAVAWLAAEGALPEAGARQAVDYLAAGRRVLSALPTQDTLVAERFFDEAGGMQLVLHAPFGARQNRALGLALRKRFCRTFDFELQAAATDDGVLLSLGPQHSFPLASIFEMLAPDRVEEVLVQAALQSPMFPIRWRWDATRALALPRVLGGRKVPPPIARMRADDLLAAVFPMAVACQDNADLHAGPVEPPDHPLVAEALRDCLTDAMDARGLEALLRRIAAGEVRLVARDLPEPSPLAHELLGAKPWAFLDDAPLEERRARAVVLRRSLPAAEASGLGALDPAAVAEVAAQARPGPRDPDELHDLLLDLGFLPTGALAPAEGDAQAGALPDWGPWLDGLVASGRAARARLGGREVHVAAERAGAWRALAGEPGVDATGLAPSLPVLPGEDAPASADEAAARALRGWMARLGPVTATGLADRLGLPEPLVGFALHRLEAEGAVLRGSFLPGGEPGEDWCDRGLLARIHRLTLGRLRREIEPVSGADLVRFLLRWQHAAPGSRLHGSRGVAEVVGQLQGFHAPAAAWEREILPARVAGYEPGLLDALCLSGEVAWGRLAVTASPDEVPRRRAAPTRHAPVTLALRPDLPWLLAASGGAAPPLGPSARRLVELLERCGACFLPDLAAMTGRLPAEVEGALWELVSAGLVTCDGFAGLRALLEPPPRHRPRRPGQGGGRWALLRPARPEAAVGAASALDPSPASPASPLEPVARQLLARWGVVMRDLLSREPLAPPWRELLPVYRTLEARGEIRGGRFVAGLSGEQFALPEAVEMLRAVRRAPPAGERVELSGADPLNLVGGILPGAKVPATLGARVAYLDGVPVAAADLRQGPASR
ncbi:MAG TPA: DEAD/DEAH box helicase [Anaeromyxobacteraceae bacterium]|nr:DEAD/DEAH box helicase [Anaeromyxobacteraceae bacterium]